MPLVTAGWAYQQTASVTTDTTPVKYYQIQLLPFVDFFLDIKSIFNIKRLWYNEFNALLAKNRWNIFISSIMSWNYKWCMGIGFDRDVTELNINMKNTFMKCSKTIWYDFCQTYNIWTGPEAKWFDDCAQTTQAVMDLTTWRYFDKVTKNIWLGSISAKSPTACKTLPLIGKTQSGEDSALQKYAKMSYSRYLDYFWNKANDDEKLNGSVQDIPSVTDAMKSFLF